MVLLDETILETDAIEIPNVEVDEGQDVVNRYLASQVQGNRNMLIQTMRAVNGGIEFGNPTDLDSNIVGTWVSVPITNVNQLGTGAGAPVTVTHNLNIPPVVVPGRAYNLPNVTWSLRRVTFGDRTGVNAAPAAIINPIDFMGPIFNLGDAVTADAIDLRFYADAGFAPSATQPLTFDLFVYPGVT